MYIWLYVYFLVCDHAAKLSMLNSVWILNYNLCCSLKLWSRTTRMRWPKNYWYVGGDLTDPNLVSAADFKNFIGSGGIGNFFTWHSLVQAKCTENPLIQQLINFQKISDSHTDPIFFWPYRPICTGNISNFLGPVKLPTNFNEIITQFNTW